ncbi:MAG: hypothetical protein ACLGIK_16145 [Gemmatimonadota bacterium]
MVRRVEQKLGRAAMRREVIRDAVDRTLGALPEAGASRAAASPSAASPSAAPAMWSGESPAATAIVAAISTPDLASQLRRQLEGAGVSIGGLAVATEGRYTVATLTVSPECADAVRGAAASLGARLSWRGDWR